MDAASLRELQAPLKARYREQPDAAHVRLHAEGSIDADAVACRLDTGRALVEAGLHPATGGSGLQACSGDMLLEALVACAGVTLRAVATALEFRLKGGTVRAEGDLDFRGTLGVDRAGRLSRDPPRLRARHRRAARPHRQPLETDRALLRRVADSAPPARAGGAHFRGSRARLTGACQPAGKTACRNRPPSPTITGEGRGLSGPAPGGIGNERSLPAKRHLYGAVPQS